MPEEVREAAEMSSSTGASPGIDTRRARLGGDHSSSVSSRLRGALANCSKFFGSGDCAGGDEAIAEVVRHLNDVAEWSSSASEGGDAQREAVAEEALSEILEFLSSPSADEMTVDALSLELPKQLVKFISVSEGCTEYVGKIIDYLLTNCNPRDMLSMLCEALDYQIKVSTKPMDFIILFGGLSKVITKIRRHHFRQIKVALPVIFKAVRAISSEFDGEDEASLLDLLTEVSGIGLSIQSVCEKLEGERKEELRAILGLYVMQNMAFLSMNNVESKLASCVSLVRETSVLLPFCGLSYLNLITGDSVESIYRVLCGDEEEDDLVTWSLLAKGGACFAVLWGSLYDDVAAAASERVAALLVELGANPMKRWQAVGMLKHVFSSNDCSWKIKSHGVELVLNVMDAVVGEDQDKDCVERSFLIPSIFGALQGLEKVMIFSADATLRKKAFSAFRKVVSDIPGLQRFDVLKALITGSSSPDMIGLLLDLVREEAHKESGRPGEEAPSFWREGALELVEMVLRPTKGGPPSFPQDSVPVLAALNLYRFVLIRASAGGRHQGGPLTAAQLRKAYSAWLLPLRALVTGIEAETRGENDGELALHAQCSLNPLQLVLYRCIELVEERLKPVN